MGDTPAFLARLGLTAGTDKQSIRRAYARELKQIDQHADAASFQTLREAYDAALAWFDRRQAPSANDSPVPNFRPLGAAAAFNFTPLPLAPIERQEKLNDPAQLAAAVFEDFEAVCGRLAEGLHARDEFYWKTALERHRDDKRLLNLDAQLVFERLVAGRLAAGWAPGNETLLVVAAELFGWMADRRTLKLLGHSGVLINQALDESLVFEAQTMTELLVQRGIVHRLRDTEPPDELQISIDITHLERMLLRFPTWLPMVLDKRTVNLWRRVYSASFGAENGDTKNSDAMANAEYGQTGSGLRAMRFTMSLIFAVFVGTLLIAAVLKPYFAPVPTPAPSPPADNYSLGPTPILPPTLAQLDEIQSRISYQPPYLAGVRLKVQFQIVLNDNGEVVAANNKHSSGITEFDNLVESAIMATTRFPSETQRIFIASFTNKK